MHPVLIFGAGKTGRGFAAHICHRSSHPFVLIDKDRRLIEQLRDWETFDVRVLSAPERVDSLRPERCYHIEENWSADFNSTTLCFTAVFGNHLDELARSLAAPLATRFGSSGSGAPLNIITCENLTGAARVLREAVFDHLDCGRSTREAIEADVGFSEAIVFKTCLGPSDESDLLLVRAEPVFDLPCDADTLREPCLSLGDLKPTRNFAHQLTRKIYTYNSINAVITYLGAERGASMLFEAARDEKVMRWAHTAAAEASQALVREYGFDRGEQDQWVARALAKFVDERLPDPLARNGADPRRKLGRDDRLIGPARLALHHSIEPRGLAEAIMAAVHFADDREPPLLEQFRSHTAGLSSDEAFEAILKEVCGLDHDEPLYEFLISHWRQSHRSDHV